MNEVLKAASIPFIVLGFGPFCLVWEGGSLAWLNLGWRAAFAISMVYFGLKIRRIK
jgi:hypothetical protein